MTTIAFNGGSLQLPNTFAVYMYSPFPVIVESASLSDVRLFVTCGGRSHTETRALFQGRAEFDLARIVQLLAPDVDGVFGMNPTQDGEACPYVAVEFELEAPDETVLTTCALWGLYGTQDQLDERFGPQRRRVWVNYPQTLQIWKDSSSEMFITGDFIDGDFYPALSLPVAAPMTEMSLPIHLGEGLGAALRDALNSGKTADVSVSCAFGGTDTLEERGFYDLALVPDLTPLGAGTYLRWLHRDGTFGYWCFRNGALNADAAQRSAFSRHLDGNPAEPQGDRYRNGVKQDFREARQLSLCAACETLDEFEYLCGLAASPVVDRMVIMADGDIRWQRVNVMPGGYARNVRYATPSLQDFEIIIELPERNTVTL